MLGREAPKHLYTTRQRLRAVPNAAALRAARALSAASRRGRARRNGIANSPNN